MGRDAQSWEGRGGGKEASGRRMAAKGPEVMPNDTARRLDRAELPLNPVQHANRDMVTTVRLAYFARSADGQKSGTGTMFGYTVSGRLG